MLDCGSAARRQTIRCCNSALSRSTAGMSGMAPRSRRDDRTLTWRDAFTRPGRKRSGRSRTRLHGNRLPTHCSPNTTPLHGQDDFRLKCQHRYGPHIAALAPNSPDGIRPPAKSLFMERCGPPRPEPHLLSRPPDQLICRNAPAWSATPKTLYQPLLDSGPSRGTEAPSAPPFPAEAVADRWDRSLGSYEPILRAVLGVALSSWARSSRCQPARCLTLVSSHDAPQPCGYSVCQSHARVDLGHRTADTRCPSTVDRQPRTSITPETARLRSRPRQYRSNSRAMEDPAVSDLSITFSRSPQARRPGRADFNQHSQDWLMARRYAWRASPKLRIARG